MLFSRQESFYRNFKFVHKNRSVQDGDLFFFFFFFENRPKSVLKDVAVYALTLHCNYGVHGVTIFKIRG